MAQTETRSLQEIKRETEQTRAGLTQTVEELRHSVAETASDIRERISPSAIKAEVRDYVRSRGEQWVNDITDAARNNPMQAVAVGASFAYPLFRLVRAIPAPILMVGAGLYLAGSARGKQVTQKASAIASDLSDQMMQRTRELGDRVGEAASNVTDYANERLGAVNQAVSDGAQQASRRADAAGATIASRSQELQSTAASTGASLADRAADAKEQAVRMAGSAADGVKELVNTAASTGQKAVETARDRALDAARTARDTASDLGGRAGKTFTDTIERNPVLVAGVGLLIGGLIASALPRSEVEDELIGGASGAVKRRARTAVSQGIDAARNAAGEAYGRAVRQAEAEGLDPEGLGNTAQDLGNRVRRVAETAVTTAFEPPADDHQPGSQGDKNHG